MNLNRTTFLVTLVSVWSVAPALAFTVIPVDPVNYSGSFTTNATGTVADSGPISTASGGSGGTSSSASSSATFSSSLTPIPSITATATASASAGATAFANVNFSLDYFFYIDGPGANTGTTIPLNVIAAATASVGGTIGPNGIVSPVGTATEGLAIQLKPGGLITQSLLLKSTSDPAGFSVNQNLNFLVGTDFIYDVTMNVQVIAGADGSATLSENATATLDPLFTIDLPIDLADQYHIFFSDGVGNGLTNGATPLPATLPMFMGGAGLIGLLARRRKQKRAA